MNYQKMLSETVQREVLTRILNEDNVTKLAMRGKRYFKSATKHWQQNHPVPQTWEPQQEYTLSWDPAGLLSDHKQAPAPARCGPEVCNAGTLREHFEYL